MREAFWRNELPTQFRARKLLLLDEQNACSVPREMNRRTRACRTSAGDSYVKSVGIGQRQYLPSFQNCPPFPTVSAADVRHTLVCRVLTEVASQENERQTEVCR